MKVTKKHLSILSVISVSSLILILFFLFGAKQDVSAPTSEEIKISNALAASPSPAPSALVGKDDILKNALNLYIQKKQAGVDMSTGPCLGPIGQDWVLDIVHNPRTKVDDEAKNQCADFRDGKAHHFIELDPDGKLIRSN